MSKKFEGNLRWLKGSITHINFNGLKEKLVIYYKYNDENLYGEVDIGKEFKPFIYLTNGKEKKFNIIKHTDFYKNIRAWKKSAGNDALLLSPETQFLIQSKNSFYKDLKLQDLKILVFDIETSSLDPKEGNLLAIGFQCNKKMKNGKKKLIIRTDDVNGEKYLLGHFLETIKEEDPDIISGHNIFIFDIPFLEYKFNKNKIPFLLGRYNQSIYKDYRTTMVSRLIKGNEFFQYRVPGRTLVDTMHLAMIEDTRRNEFEGYGLKSLAVELNLNPDDRVYLEPEEIVKLYYEKDSKFEKYLEDDLKETMGLTRMFLPSYVQTCKFVPINLQDMVYAGSIKKAMSLFTIDYYHAGRAIPMPQDKVKFEGGLSRATKHGVFDNVHKVDVSSLYPNTMEVFKYFPASDTLGVMEKYLKIFKTERLKYKKLLGLEEEKIKAGEGDEFLKDEYNAYQLALKIFINSYYGILGTPWFPWNDFEMAAAVTRKGREILLKMIEIIEECGGTVLSMDTDGAYFSLPEGVDEIDVLDKINKTTPKGIDVELEKSFKSMFSYKGKTYAALYYGDEEKILLKGSAFKGRGIPPFLRKFIKTSVKYILKRDKQSYSDQLQLLKTSLAERMLDLTEVIESKNIKYDYATYIERETGGKIGHFEAMEREGRIDKYKPGSRVKFYFSGDTFNAKQKNEMVKLFIEKETVENNYNSDYYIDKVNKWESNFKEFI